jgi:uncharacterized membrane protein YGL010W
MPTRSYLFPNDFQHVEAILRSENPELTDSQFQNFCERGIAPLFTSLDIAIVLGIGPQLVASIMKRKKSTIAHFRSKKRMELIEKYLPQEPI